MEKDNNNKQTIPEPIAEPVSEPTQKEFQIEDIANLTFWELELNDEYSFQIAFQALVKRIHLLESKNQLLESKIDALYSQK